MDDTIFVAQEQGNARTVYICNALAPGEQFSDGAELARFLKYHLSADLYEELEQEVLKGATSMFEVHPAEGDPSQMSKSQILFFSEGRAREQAEESVPHGHPHPDSWKAGYVAGYTDRALEDPQGLSMIHADLRNLKTLVRGMLYYDLDAETQDRCLKELGVKDG